MAHIENRLAHERAMLAEDDGTLADLNKPEKGALAAAGLPCGAVGPTSRR